MRWSMFFIMLLMGVLFAQSNEDCLMCHGEPDLTGLDSTNHEVSMYVDAEKFAGSIHADLSCVDCHEDLAGVEDFPHAETLAPVNCGNCHDDAAEEYSASMHGLKFINKTELAPKCWDCHGKHDILSSDNPASRTYFQNLHNTCYGCHSQKNLLNSDSLRFATVTMDYLQGVHGKLVIEGVDSAPTCNTCHPAHNIRKRIDPQSTIYRMNISSTCGQCHVDELANYSESIHYKALSHGIIESATCTDCHGEHRILSPDSAYVLAANDACVQCHNNPKLIKKYGLSATAVSTYEDSYHGLSVRLGKKNAATCASCHGNHTIYRANDPFSPVNKQNVVQTCSKCHKNVTPAFANSYTHESMLIRTNPVNYYISFIYILLIITVIGGMFGHNIIIFLKYIRYKKLEEKQFYIVRFRPSEVLQHGVLLVSFSLLALTGFALKFPNAWWVEMFEKVGINETGRSIMHRICAVALVGISLYHLYYIAFTKRGKHLFIKIFPTFTDVREFFQTLKYYLGLSKNKPRYGEFDYTEKVEYWAVVWGTVIMGLTGVVLWFPTIVTSFSPSWVVRAAELVHYFEAILATLAIVIFHLFFVIAHPEQYPMNLSWLTGKMSLRAAIRKHPRWVENLLKEKKNLDLLPEVIRNNCETLNDVENYLKFGDLYDELKKGKIY